MSGANTSSPVTRLAVAILVIVVLVATAVGVTIWRYDHALEQSDAAQESTSEEHTRSRRPRRSGTSARR